MRERTPSADDTPKRAPPAPSREAASADVLVDGRSARVVLADSSRSSRFAQSSSTVKRTRTMVASTRGLDELATSQSTVNDLSQQQQQQPQQQQQQHQHSQNRLYLHTTNNNLHISSSSQYNNSERHVATNYRSAQTAQDKRSRLSNVINNLRKKVPTESPSVDDSQRPREQPSVVEQQREDRRANRVEEDDSRNSVERNLANLEKYVMTVLNGVIKDAESKDEVKAEGERAKATSDLASDAQNPIGSSRVEILVRKDNESEDAGNREPSRPNESRLEAAVPGQPEVAPSKIVLDDKSSCNKKDDKSEDLELRVALPAEASRGPSLDENDEPEDRVQLGEDRAAESLALVVAKTSNDPNSVAESQRRLVDNDVDRLSSGVVPEAKLCTTTNSLASNVLEDSSKLEKDLKDRRDEDEVSSTILKNQPSIENTEIIEDASAAALPDEKRLNNRSLGTIILDRLTEHQAAIPDESSGDLANSEFTSLGVPETGSESDELRTICRDLLNELLNDISQLIEDTPGNGDDSAAALPDDKISEDDVEDVLVAGESVGTSIQCSLPLDKVASMLKNCQSTTDSASTSTSPSVQQTCKSPPKPPSPTVRHLCLYCDRKFLSISLRQRHTDRVHQLGGGRRSERNSRKTSQNCQYCSDKCADSLDGLFQHMIGKHGDKYHACVQCTTRYSTREVLVSHLSDVHGYNSNDKLTERSEKPKDSSATFKEPVSPASRDLPIHSGREKTSESTSPASSEQRRIEDELERRGCGEPAAHSANTSKTQSSQTQSSSGRDVPSNPGSPEFDSTFYSSVSCNIRENLLHHLDGKLQPVASSNIAPPTAAAASSNEPKSQIQSPQHQQQQNFYENSVNQTQYPIDISLTAATPVYSKDYSGNDEYGNSSEYAQKPGKTGRSHPRRVSFEKYNFPRKYDGKEQWSCSIKDLSKFDITTQLTLRKKQQLIKERLTTGRLQHATLRGGATNVDVASAASNTSENELERKNGDRIEDSSGHLDTQVAETDQSNVCSSGRTFGAQQSFGNDQQNIIEDSTSTDDPESSQDTNASSSTEFTAEFSNFLRLRKWNECHSETKNSQEIVYAELTGEWSRPRIYICGACTSRHLTLREMEEHKASSHPNVWCSHLEFTGDQRELYKHLFLPGRCMATTKAKNAVLAEKVCTKCSKTCGSLAELHRHMLECGGDQAWLLGLFGNGKKKCKWRPFGSRSRRRRQRGMKRNIQNSQTPRVNQPRERNSAGPRVRPSDRESIQKMLANLPPKRASRRVMQDTAVRTQGRLRKMQTRSRPRLAEPIPSNSRLSRKAVLRNKLLKNAKSFQRKLCRGDNITAAIESVVTKDDADEEVDDDSDEEEEEEEEDDVEDDSGRVFKESRKFESGNARGETSKAHENLESSNRSTKIVRGVRVVSKKRNVKSKDPRNVAAVKSRGRVMKKRRTVDSNESEENTTRNSRNSSRNNDKNSTNYSSDNQADGKSQSSNSSSPSHSAISRRKKHVNPVISLHASLKARSQLRTHDGKFARKNVNADIRGTRSSSGAAEKRGLVVTPAALRTLTRRQDSGRLVTRAKLRTTRRASNDAKVTRRTVVKRNSSDSQKTPILEAADEESDDEEKLADKSATDLPILSSVQTSGNTKSEQKNSRGPSRSSSSASKTNTGNNNKQQGKNLTDLDLDDAIEKSVIDVTQLKNNAQNSNREQRPTRARRKKTVVSAMEKSEKNETEAVGTSKDESPARVADSTREFRARNRLSLPARASSSTDYSEESLARRRCSSKDSKSREADEEETSRKSSKSELQNSDDKKTETIGRVNPRQARQERRAGSLEDFSKLQQVPDEVKKLLGPSDDLFAQIGLKKREKTKRNVRQPQKPRANTPKTRIQKKILSAEDSKAEESEQDTELKDKIALRKSPRYADKKEPKIVDKMEHLERNDEKNIESHVSANKIEESEIDVKAEDIISVEKTLADKSEDNPKASNDSIAKRRGRIKSHADEGDREMSGPEGARESEESEEQLEAVNNSAEETIDAAAATATENLEDEETSSDQMPKDLTASSDVATLSFEHLQQESNNSNIDSGKENSSETPVNVSKLKVVRPKKSRGLRRDRLGKRTLNNVIGILTEGVNIPVEVQQSVVLTVQTSIEGATSETGVQSNPGQTGDGNVAAGEASNARASVKPNESSDAACSSEASEESGDSQVSQQIESVNVDKSKENCAERSNTNVQQIQCYSVPELITAAPIPAKPIDTAQPEAAAAAAAVEQPANDIILDLSRRKPKGKGSFLEKIVSKIAKQKDALLEIEVGCLLDHAADELTSILDEVSPTSKEPPETSPRSSGIGSVNNAKVPAETFLERKEETAEESKEDNHIVISSPVASSAAIETTTTMTTTTENAAVSMQSNASIGEAKNRGEIEVQPTEKQTLGSGILPNASQELSAALEPLPESPLVEAAARCSESTRNSRKRSLDAATPKKNKRKTVDDDESESNSSEDEICLADIMKLINSTKQTSPRTEEKFDQKVRPGKRKTMELDRDETSALESSAEFVAASNDGTNIQSNGSDVINKKSKRNSSKKTSICEESEHDCGSEAVKKSDQVQSEVTLKNSVSVADNFSESLPKELNTSTPDVQKLINETKINVTSDSELAKPLEQLNLVKQSELLVADDKSKTKQSRKASALKKKSLADEHLNLSDDEPSEDICNLSVSSLSRSSVDESSNSTVDTAFALNLSVSSQEVTNPSPVESFKVPELNEFLGSSKKRSAKKKSLAAEHLELLHDTTCSLPKDLTLPESLAVKTDADSSTSEANEDDKKAGDETKVEEEKHQAEVQACELDEVKTVEVSAVEKIVAIETDQTEHNNKQLSNNESAADDEKALAEATQTDTSVTDSECAETDEETAADKRNNLSRKAKENASSLVDELGSISDPKLQRKFAVVHTKSGKMLIVEKKKKFTKEAAKFFCEVCAASFTRKSSLKKHNLSQFHLLQLSKCGDDLAGENNYSGVEEDATVSSIDASDDVSNSVKLAGAAKEDPLATEVDESSQNQNIDNDTTDNENETIGQEPLGKSPEEESDAAVSPANTPEAEETAFGNQDALEDDLEDELLDEEICKITENMTHDEYVLTDHVSPVLPEAASTPVNNAPAKAIVVVPEPVEKAKETKRKRKQDAKKINLADEHLDLDSPVPTEIATETAIPPILDESIDEPLNVTSILNIPQIIPVQSKTTNELAETTSPEKLVPIKMIEATVEIVDPKNSTTRSDDSEDLILEKPLKSRRKNNKRSIGKVADTNKNQNISVMKVADEKHEILLKDTESFPANSIEETSTLKPEKTAEAIIEIQSETAVYDFLPKLSDDLKDPEDAKQSIGALDFSNITEKLKAQESNNANNLSGVVEFDSDEDTSDTNMSNDIRKILDDPELDADNKQAATGLINEKPEALETTAKTLKRVVTPAKRSKQQKGKSEAQADENVVNLNEESKQCLDEEQMKTTLSRQSAEKKSTRSKQPAVKEPAKKPRITKPRRNNNASRNKLAEDSSDSEFDDKKDGTESQNKNKIVKCVFGRVFAGEKVDKVDKVKEVLDDWVSRSESDSHDESQASLDGSSIKVAITSAAGAEQKKPKNDDEKSSRSRNRKRAHSKNKTRDASSGSENPGKDESSVERRSRSKSAAQTRKRNIIDKKVVVDSISPKVTAAPSVDLTPSSRCRQSKKRAEERISRAFEDESSIAFDDHVLMSQLQLLSNAKTSRHGKETREDGEVKAASKKQPSAASKNKKRVQDENPEETIESQNSECGKIVRSTLGNNATPSSKKGRSQSPDLSSQKTLDSATNDPDETSTVVEAEDEEDEDEIAMGRLSPLYVCNSPDSSINSDTNSDEEDNTIENLDNRATSRRSTSAFSGDKVVIRSPTSLMSSNREDRTEVVTIAPTDAIEDNALDVPREIETSPSQKPRQGKVLNFDEELFVECCSRLKATTENELRGAKKIKLDHSVAYNRNDDQGQGFGGSRDRWRDVESQNSLGSLLESVNQLLGEEMYSGSRADEYAKRGRNMDSARSSRTASPDVDASRQETLGYEDSLDVAFEHNNKLRVKIQQRMRESENLIASTFSQKSSRGSAHRHHHHHHHHHGRREHANESAAAATERSNDVNQSLRNGENYTNILSVKNNDRSSLSSTIDQTAKHVELECSNFRSKNPALGGLLDKALSNILHSNGKHDHNGSTPMNVLAELACARVPTATIPEVNSPRDKSLAASPTRTRESSVEERVIVNRDAIAPKKARNPIKELFERKKEINERKQQQQQQQQHHERSENNDVALREINAQRSKKSKKPKRQQQQDFPLIRKSQLGGMVERKKRRDGADRKTILGDAGAERIKDVYDFDEEESQPEGLPGAVLPYRNKNEKTYEVMSCAKTKELDMADLMTKTIGETLKNGKTGDALGRRLESMINRKFQEIETFTPKTKGALKSFQMEEKQQQQQQQQEQQQQQVTGPMDDFVERKQRSKKLTEPSAVKHGRSKRRSKISKKKSRNAWYENDSSDEFITAAKAEDVGVGISKSQRTCSKGKQNLFAELSTSSESEYEDEEVGYEAKRRLARLSQKKILEKQREKEQRARVSPELADNYPQEHEDHGIVDWMTVTSKTDSKNDLEHKKSESEMSDHPLVIDERKTETDEQRNSDDDTETRYNPAFELDDLYREDTSVADSDPEEDANERTEGTVEPEDSKTTAIVEATTSTNEKVRYSEEKELIPLEEALDLLDKNEDLDTRITERKSPASRTVESLDDRKDSVNIGKETKSQDKEEDDEEDEEEREDFKEVENECNEASIPEEPEEDLPALPEKLSGNEKPQKGAENLPLHVFLSRKVQESKKRKQQQQKKMQEEQERILMEFAPTRRQRKCAIGKQGLLAEISSSDEETYTRETCRRSAGEKSDHERQSRKPKRESKEKRKERYLEKKHEQIIAKEQKAIEEEILRELEKTKGSSTKSDSDSGKSERNVSMDNSVMSDKSEVEENEAARTATNAAKKKRQQKARRVVAVEDSRNNAENYESENIDNETLGAGVAEHKSNSDESLDNGNEQDSPSKPKRQSKSSQRAKKTAKTPDAKAAAGGNRKSRISNTDRAKSRPTSTNSKDPKERRSSSGKRDSDDEELRTTKCWNKVEEGVGVAIGRRKRAAANQLYYWSSSSDDDEPIPAPTPVVEEEDDRQEQHGWIVGDSHKRMITMLAMEKQLKEKRRRSEDEFEPGKAKNKKHRNSTS